MVEVKVGKGKLEKVGEDPFGCIHLEWRKCPVRKTSCCAYCVDIKHRIADCGGACICTSESKAGFHCGIMPSEYKLRVVAYLAYTNHGSCAWLNGILKEMQKKYDVVMNLVKKIADASEKFTKKESKIIKPGE